MNFLEALSDNIVIDPDKCTFCGVCVETCILDNLRLQLAPCRAACPLKVNCQGYVQLILRGREQEALEMVAQELAFPEILARLCSAPCEKACQHNKQTGAAVAIRLLKRYLTDLALDGNPSVPDTAAPSGKRCAIIGSGPAGMVAAFDLRRRGHDVVLMDAENEPGGMLRWAIPEFRLPLQILSRELGKLEAMGVVFQGGTVLGRDISLAALAEAHDAVIVATGCPKPKKIGIPGEEVAGVFHALPFLRAVRSGKPPVLGPVVVVIGGGDVAMDSAQTALRLGAQKVTVVSLESDDIMPASQDILKMAQSEGVHLEGSWGPSRILPKDNRVAGLELQRCLAVFDRFGRFAPTFDDCSLKTLDADSIIVAIGQKPEMELFGGTAPTCNPLTLQSEWETVFFAGDCINGPSTIVDAMASGRTAAESVHRLFTGQHLGFGRSYPGPVETEFAIDTSRGSGAERLQPDWKKYAGRGDFTELEQTPAASAARQEAGRCYSCGLPFGKFRTCWFCLPCEVECPHDALWVEIPYLLR